MSREAGIAIGVAGALMYLFLFGNFVIFETLGITLATFQVAGGIFLFLLGLQETLGITLGTAKKTQSSASVIIGTPLLCGPGTITTVLLFSKEFGIPVVALASAISLAGCWLVLRVRDPDPAAPRGDHNGRDGEGPRNARRRDSSEDHRRLASRPSSKDLHCHAKVFLRGHSLLRECPHLTIRSHPLPAAGLHFHPAPIEPLYTHPGNPSDREEIGGTMENVGYILMDRMRVLDGEGNEEEILSLNIRGRRFGIRTSEMEEILGGGTEARVERLRRNWRFYLDGVDGVAEVSRSGKALNIEPLRVREIYHLPAGPPLGPLGWEPLRHGRRVPGERTRLMPRRGPATYQAPIPVTATS